MESLNRANIEQKLDYAINLISNLGEFFRNGLTETKIQLLGSMFPEKIEFDGNNIEPNPTIKYSTLFTSKPMSYEVRLKKKKGRSELLPNSVPRAGVEPARVAPLVFETSASTDSAIWA